MRFVLPLILLLTAAVPAAAQTFQYKDAAALHNDIYALGTRMLASDAANQAALLGKLDVLHTDMQALVAALKAAPVAAPTSTPDPAPTPTTTLADPCSGRTDKWIALTLSPSSSIKAALACAAPGFKLTLTAGTWGYQAVNFNLPANLGAVEIAGAGAGLTKLDGGGGCTVAINNLGSGGGCATRLAYGNGVVRTETSLYIHDLEITGGGTAAVGGHDLQAGLYLAVANGTVTAERVMFRGNQNGVAGNASFFTNSTVNIKSSDFVGNSTDGGSHDTYISGAGSTLNISDSNFYGSLHGNNSKSRVPFVNVSGGYNRSGVPGTGEGGRWIECADGCTLKITGGTYVGNDCCTNVFGNGTESTSIGPGNTTWSGSAIWFGPRSQTLSNAGTFSASAITARFASGASVVNDKGSALTGMPASGAAGDPPAVPAYVSGAK